MESASETGTRRIRIRIRIIIIILPAAKFQDVCPKGIREACMSVQRAPRSHPLTQHASFIPSSLTPHPVQQRQRGGTQAAERARGRGGAGGRGADRSQRSGVRRVRPRRRQERVLVLLPLRGRHGTFPASSRPPMNCSASVSELWHRLHAVHDCPAAEAPGHRGDARSGQPAAVRLQPPHSE
jgi:hypothetical protein